MRTLRLLASLVLLLALVPGTAAPEPAKRYQCISDAPQAGCRDGRALKVASWVTVSPDDRNVYVGVQGTGAVAVFRRDRGTGELSQLHGKAGCVASGGADGCAGGRGLAVTRPVAVSPDSRNVYAGSDGGVASFSRDLHTGALHQLPGKAGCTLVDATQGCARSRNTRNVRALIVSQDGRTLYVAANISNTLAIFSRNPRTGAIKQRAGTAGCISEEVQAGCAKARGLIGPRGVVFSPDQHFLYLTAEGGFSVAVFRRDLRTGAVSQLTGRPGCLGHTAADGCAPTRGLASPHELEITPNGLYAYVASTDDDAVAVLHRDLKSGVLTQPAGSAGCLAQGGAEGCAPARALDGSHSVALGRRGRRVFVAGNKSNAIAVFRRSTATGDLHQPPGRNGCFAITSELHCIVVPGLLGVHRLAVSHDGRGLYAASESANAVVFVRLR